MTAVLLAMLVAAPPALPRGDAPSSSTLAEAYRAARRYPEAIREYERLVSAQPDAARLRARLAELYAWTGDYDRAIAAYKVALERAPGAPDIECGLARVLRWSRRYGEAEDLYREVLAADPLHRDALDGLARTLSLEGDRAQALAVLDRALAAHPHDAELHDQRGIVLGWDGQYDQAVASLATASRLAPNDPSVWRDLGDVQGWMHHPDEALRAYARATALQPENAQNHVSLAKAYLALGKSPLAAEQVDVALRLAPFDADALALAARLDDRVHPDARTFGAGIELLGYVFVASLVTVASRRHKRVLQRRYRAYHWFVRYVIPPFALASLAVHAGRPVIARWADPDVVRSIAQGVLLVGMGIAFTALLRAERTQRELRGQVIVAIGAHPDDIELGCGGFIMKAKASGARVYGLTLTRGERGAPRGQSRVTELARAARYMRLDDHWVLDFPDTRLQECVTRMKEAIEEKLVAVGATTVLTHTDVDIHGDHRAVYAATREAARDVPTVLSYEDVSTPNEFVPNYYVDITDYVEDELKLVSFHRSQAHREYMDPEVIKGRAAHRGLQSGVTYAEAFRAHRIIQ